MVTTTCERPAIAPAPSFLNMSPKRGTAEVTDDPFRGRPSRRVRTDVTAPAPGGEEELPLEELLEKLDESSLEERALLFREFADRLANDESGRSWRHLFWLMHHRVVGSKEFYVCRNKMPVSFSRTTFDDVRKMYNLKSINQIQRCSPPSLYVSNVVRRQIFQEIHETEKTTCALADATNEAKVVVWTTAVIKRILLQFDGNINNDAEGRHPSTASSSGGFVEFIYTVLEMIVVLVMEGKTASPTSDNCAQLMVELEAAYYQNTVNDLSLALMQGVICSQQLWEFWTYDGIEFRRSRPYLILAGSEVENVKAQLEVFDLLYGAFFRSYLMALESFIYRSKQKAAKQNVARRPSQAKWTEALKLGKRAYELAEAAKTDEEFDAAHAVLRESFLALPDEHTRFLFDPVAAFDRYLAGKTE